MWIKICGVRSVADAVMVARAGADAVGLNFYSASKRFVSVNSNDDPTGATQAAVIRKAVAGQLEVVGVFVNSSVDDVATIAAAVPLDTVQFHGDETPEDVAEFHRHCPDVGVIRAFRVGASGTADMQSQLDRIRELGITLRAVLVDALVPGEYGGTGHMVNADVVNTWQRKATETPPLILAGGLTPETVATAIADVRPWGVDTASGVESSPGVKSASATDAFCATCRGADGGSTVR